MNKQRIAGLLMLYIHGGLPPNIMLIKMPEQTRNVTHPIDAISPEGWVSSRDNSGWRDLPNYTRTETLTLEKYIIEDIVIKAAFSEGQQKLFIVVPLKDKNGKVVTI